MKPYTRTLLGFVAGITVAMVISFSSAHTYADDDAYTIKLQALTIACMQTNVALDIKLAGGGPAAALNAWLAQTVDFAPVTVCVNQARSKLR